MNLSKKNIFNVLQTAYAILISSMQYPVNFTIFDVTVKIFR
jgi:hypothetical protein